MSTSSLSAVALSKHCSAQSQMSEHALSLGCAALPIDFQLCLHLLTCGLAYHQVEDAQKKAAADKEQRQTARSAPAPADPC